MDLAAYLGSVLAVAGVAIGAMWIVVGTLGTRFTDVNTRIDDTHRRIENLDGHVAARLDRIETQNEAIMGAVRDIADRLTKLENRG